MRHFPGIPDFLTIDGLDYVPRPETGLRGR